MTLLNTVLSPSAVIVTNTSDSGPGSLRAAITYANAHPGSIITFQSGLSGTITLASALPQITVGMSIQGNPSPVIAVDGAGQYRPFSINASGATVAISNVTVQNGSDVPDLSGGAAIFAAAGTVAIRNCTVSGNRSQASNFVSSCILNAGTMALSNCTVTGNTGGGIYNSGTAALTATTLSNNTSLSGGVGIYNDGTILLANCTIVNNEAGGQGGGIYNNNSATITNCTLSGNGALDGGGIANYGVLAVGFSTIANCGGELGGGILNRGSAVIDDCTLTGNAAQNAGGANDNSNSVTLVNCTVTNNSVTMPGQGGAIAGAAGVTLVNCILYDDSAQSGSEIDSAGSASVTYSDIEGGYAGTGNINADPLLGDLASNGGPTQTMALGAGSPCYSAGTRRSTRQQLTSVVICVPVLQAWAHMTPQCRHRLPLSLLMVGWFPQDRMLFSTIRFPALRCITRRMVPHRPRARRNIRCQLL